MKIITSSILTVVIVCLFQSCAPGKNTAENEILRLAVDVPEFFETPSGMSWGDNSCKNPIIDPQDGTELILIQSGNGMGDYKVNRLKYGVSERELLRINCNTGAVIGIVRR